MTSYSHGKGSNAFIGGVFDGQNIWLAPNSSPDLVKVNPADGSMTSYAHGKGATAFACGVFDGQNIWLVPYSSTDLVKVNPADGSMTSYAHGKGSNAFRSGVFDGQNIWLVPYSSTDLVKVTPIGFGRVENKRVASLYSEGGLTNVGITKLGDGSTTNYAQFAADGELTLAGTARVNKIINLGITGLPSGTAAPTVARVGNYYGYQFNSINDAGYVGSFEIPYDWDSTTAIIFKIHWYANNTSAAKMVQWQVDYNATAENTEQVNAATTTLTTGDLAVSTTAYRLTETEITIAAANLAFDDVVAVMVKRIAASGGGGVVPDNAPVIVSLEIEYVSNKLGEAT